MPSTSGIVIHLRTPKSPRAAEGSAGSTASISRRCVTGVAEYRLRSGWLENATLRNLSDDRVGRHLTGHTLIVAEISLGFQRDADHHQKPLETMNVCGDADGRRVAGIVLKPWKRP